MGNNFYLANQVANGYKDKEVAFVCTDSHHQQFQSMYNAQLQII